MRYYRVMLGEKSKYKTECYNGKFIGCNFEIKEDLKKYLTYIDKETFTQSFRETYLKYNDGAEDRLVSSECRQIWVICKDIKKEDIVICPDGKGSYYLGKIVSEYHFITESNIELRHRRKVEWFDKNIERENMSDGLKRITRSHDTVIEVTKYADEIERCLQRKFTPTEDELKLINKAHMIILPVLAFIIILPVLAKYIAKILLKRKEDNWWKKYVLDKLRETRDLPQDGSREEYINELDVSACLRIIISNWDEIFKHEMDIHSFDLAHSLLSIRNKEGAHYTSKILTKYNYKDVDYALGQIIHFMRPIDTNVAEQISEIKREFEIKYKKKT